MPNPPVPEGPWSLNEYLGFSDAAYTIDGMMSSNTNINIFAGFRVIDVGEAVWLKDGFAAVALEDRNGDVIIVNEGTVPGISAFDRGTIFSADIQIGQGNPNTPALRDARAFAVQVEDLATELEGHSVPIYVTGHSLGGIEAEAEAEAIETNPDFGPADFGGGATFGATGLPGMDVHDVPINEDATPKLIDYVDQGDMVGNFALDTQTGTPNPLAPQSAAYHYGEVQEIGPASHAAYLKNAQTNFVAALDGLAQQTAEGGGIAASDAVKSILWDASALLYHPMSRTYIPELTAPGTVIPPASTAGLPSLSVGWLVQDEGPFYGDPSASGFLNQTVGSDGNVVTPDFTGSFNATTDQATIDQTGNIATPQGTAVSGGVTTLSIDPDTGVMESATYVTADGSVFNLAIDETTGNPQTLEVNEISGASYQIDYTYNTDGSISEVANGYSGANLTGTLQFTQTTAISTSGQVSVDISGSGDSVTLNNAAITLEYGSSATIAGANNTITFDTVDSKQVTFKTGAYTPATEYDNTGDINVALVHGDPMVLGTLSVNTSTDADSLTLTDGEAITLGGITSDVIAAVSAWTSPLQTLVDYLGNLGDSTTTTALDSANTSYLYSSGLPSQGTTLNLSTHSGVVSQTEFNAFTSITGTGTITAANSGTFDLATSNVTGGAQNLTATDWLGTTLIGNNENSQTLTASLFGNDKLYAGNGTGDTLTAGAGVDTLVGGTGGDAFVAAGAGNSYIDVAGSEVPGGSLAAGSSITGTGTGNSLTVSGDITGVSISGIQTLYTGDTTNGLGAPLTNSLTLTNAQFNGFSAISGTGTDYDPLPPFTINAATSGTYNLGAKDSSSTDEISMTALSNGGTTLIGNDGDFETLTASATGNDTLTAGSGVGDVLIGGGGTNTLSAGGGEGSLTTSSNGNNTLTVTSGSYSLTASGSGNNALTAGDSADDTLTAGGDGDNTLIAGDGAGDTLTASGNGNNTLTAGDGAGDTLNASGSGNNTLTAGNGAGDTLTASGTGVNTLIGGTGGDTFEALDGLASGSEVEGSGTVTGNGLFAGGDITGATLTDIGGLVLSANILTLTASQFGAFDGVISSTAWTAEIDGATSGTYDLGAVDSSTTQTVNMTALASGGTTLIGSNGASEVLTASATGNDTLTAGNGAGDSLIAGTGVDTLEGGTGGDTFTAASGLASGSSVTGSGTGNVLVATGNISGATISGIQTLDLVGSVILTSAQYGSFTTVTGTGSYALIDGSITAAAAAALAGTTGYTPVVVIDTAANVTANLDALQTLASDSELASVTFTDPSAPLLSITATQLSGDATAIALITGTYSLAISGVTAANAASVAATTGVASVGVSDTSANVTANIAALETLAAAGELTGIALTDSGTPALSFDAADAAANIDAIAAITTAFTLGVTDTAANVTTNIDALGSLAAIGGLTGITLTDGGTPTLTISATQAANDAGALSAITGSYLVGISDVGANVAASLDALQTLATASLLASVTLTDSSTPTLSITETQLADDTGALAAISGSYNLAVDSAVAADAATVAGDANVTSVSVADTAANVVTNIAALETLAAATTLTGIVLTDSTTPTLTISETQLTGDVDALALIAVPYALAITGVAAADASAVAAEPFVTSVSVSDTAANVAANIDALQALTDSGTLAGVSLTDGGTPTLSLDSAQLATDAAAIALIGGSYHLAASGVPAGLAASVAGETGVTGVAVADTAANVAANLDALETLAGASTLTSITLADPGTPVLTITATQLSGDATALAAISGSYGLAVTAVTAGNAATVAAEGHVVSVGVSDTAANVTTNIAALQTLAAAGALAGIVLTDGGTPTLTLSYTQLTADATALGLISSAYHLSVTSVPAASAATVGTNSHVTGIAVSDTAANVATSIGALETLGTKLTGIVLTDGGTPTLSITYTQLTGDATALGKISSAYDLAVSAVSVANAATVAAETHVTTVSVSDTAANVVSGIAGLETLATASTLTSIVLTDGGTPTLTLTYTQFTGDATAIGLITSSYHLGVTGVLAANAATVAAGTHVTSITLSARPPT